MTTERLSRGIPNWVLVIIAVGVAIGMWFAFANPLGSSASDISLSNPASAAAPRILEQSAPSAAAPATKNTAPAVTIVQLSPAQMQIVNKQLTSFFGSAMPSSDPTRELAYQLMWALRVEAGLLDTVITSELLGPITQEANGANSARVRVKVTAWTGPNTVETDHKDVTLYFTLNPNKSIQKYTGIKE